MTTETEAPTQAVALRDPQALAFRHELSIEDLVAQVAKIQLAMQRVMRDREHYGKIPGTDKPTLLKPGAEKLCLLFRLDPQYEVMPETVRADSFISYTVRCTLWHIPSGQRVASGLGACNSREAKYRYRYVPTERKPSKDEAAKLKAAGQGRWRKDDGGSWLWMERIEHDNPHDHDNTLLKMACKRALVAAVLNGTAASDIFTQDLEDLTDTGVLETPVGRVDRETGEVLPAQASSSAPPPADSHAADAPPPGTITDPQRKRLWAIARGSGWTEDQVLALLAEGGFSADVAVTRAAYDTIIDALKSGPAKK